MQAFRIADRRFPIFDGTGASLIGGRWNSPGRAMIYAAETFAGAVLEILAHSNLGGIPQTHALVETTIPEAVSMEAIGKSDLRGWGADDQIASRRYGDQWLLEQRSAVLLVPSVVSGGRERNVLINPEHPGFARIVAGKPQELRWDKRLFQR
ncbi:MAG TPA: RES domain-containing protein [Terriglobales bacterium]|nr:RES domain-containing protein [Terriglobales bacterium]